MMRGHIAPFKKGRSSHVVGRSRAMGSLHRSNAWWISQSQQQGARFWTGTYAKGHGM